MGFSGTRILKRLERTDRRLLVNSTANLQLIGEAVERAQLLCGCRTGEEGKQELNWIIPVRGGPSYEAET